MTMRLIILILVLATPLTTPAATWTVRQNGSGHFTTVKQALNAVASGDTIMIGPGEFSDPTTISLPGYSYPVVSYAVVRVPELTIIGAGVEHTWIGPATFEGGVHPSTPQGLTCDVTNARLTIRDLTVANCQVGLVVRGAMQMDNCLVYGANAGMYWLPSGSGGHLRNTTFHDPWSPAGGSLVVGDGTPVAGGLVEDCVIPGSLQVRGVRGLAVRDCELGSATFMLGATVDLVRCSTSVTGNGITQAVGTGAVCNLDDCTIRGADSALIIDPSAPGARFAVTNSRLEGGTRSILWARSGSGPCSIAGSDLVKGGGVAVLCEVSTATVVHDLRNNWWGTSNPADIATWIVDHADNAAIGATVLYTPFADQSVPIQAVNLGDLKASYR